MTTINNGDNNINESIKVYIRQRPYIDNENNEDNNISNNDNNNINKSKLKDYNDNGKCCYYSNTNKRDSNFKFDGFFGPNKNQEQLYMTTTYPIVKSALDGYSGTILVYGPTNSGKTFTMRGKDDNNTKGIIPRVIEQILHNNNDNSIEIWISYLQIYCEVISDLLINNNDNIDDIDNNDLHIREKANGKVYVENLSKNRIFNKDDLMELLHKGDSRRATEETLMNLTSSRSHAALIITLIIPDDNNASFKESTLVLVDLAGSERASATTGLNFMRAEEAKAINLSLSSLGNCMSALAERRQHIPYRDSKLTRLLQCSLGGNSRTSIIVNIPPGYDNTGEVLNSLRFASRASKVRVEASITKCLNFEALYIDAKKQLDDIKKREKGSTREVDDCNVIIDRQTSEISLLKQELAALKGEVMILRNSNNVITSSSLHRSSSSSSNDNNGNNDKNDNNNTETVWKNKLQELTDNHIADITSLSKKYELKISSLKNELNNANKEISDLQDEVKDEREKHLITVKDMRKIHDKVLNTERKFGDRIQELLTEVSDKSSIIDELHAALETSSDLIKSLSLNNENLENQMRNMIDIEQVQEIEKKFMDTVTRLTNRVTQLEKEKGQLSSTSLSSSISTSIINSNSMNNINRNSKIEQGRIKPLSSLSR
jgi:kinesin family protein 5